MTRRETLRRVETLLFKTVHKLRDWVSQKLCRDHMRKCEILLIGKKEAILLRESLAMMHKRLEEMSAPVIEPTEFPRGETTRSPCVRVYGEEVQRKPQTEESAQGRVFPVTRKNVSNLASEEQSRDRGFAAERRTGSYCEKQEIPRSQDLPGKRGKLLGDGYAEKSRARGVPENLSQVESVDDFRTRGVPENRGSPRNESSRKSRRRDVSKKGDRNRNPGNRFLPGKDRASLGSTSSDEDSDVEKGQMKANLNSGRLGRITQRGDENRAAHRSNEGETFVKERRRVDVETLHDIEGPRRTRKTDRHREPETDEEVLPALDMDLERCSVGSKPGFKLYDSHGGSGKIKAVDRLYKVSKSDTVGADKGRSVFKAAAEVVGSQRTTFGEKSSQRLRSKRRGLDSKPTSDRDTLKYRAGTMSGTQRGSYPRQHRSVRSTSEESDSASEDDLTLEESKRRIGKDSAVHWKNRDTERRSVLSSEDDDESMSDGDPPRKNYHKTKFGKRSVTEKRVATGTDRGIRIKLEKYDGKTAVAAFLAKFEVCARCNRWSDQEKTDQLMCALTGPASQLLWDMGAQENVTWKDLVLQLKARYGSEDQKSLYRIKLRTYRQGQGESLSNVVQEIRRMMALAYPGPSSDIVETVACDAFIDALANQDLAQKVREREPANLEAAYKHAVRLDAYGRSSDHGNDMYRRHGRVKATKEDWKSSGGVV